MTTIQWLDSTTTGAPVLNGVAGTLEDVLDASLVDGWGVQTVDSIVILANVATVTKAGHPFKPGQVAQISGATVSGGSINGRQKVVATSSGSYTFATTGIANQTATGTIEHKVAPLGWTKLAQVGNFVAYRNNASTGTGCYLQIDTTGTTVANCRAFFTMTDAVTGVGPFPTTVQYATGLKWAKSGIADSVARDWVIVGDDRTFYFKSRPYGSANWEVIHGFGDFKSCKTVDPYACFLSAPNALTNTPATATNELSYNFWSSSVIAMQFACRGVSGVGGGSPVYPSFPNLNGFGQVSWYSGWGLGMTFPNPGDNALYVSKINFVEQNKTFRGHLRGLYATPQDMVSGTPFPEFSTTTGVTTLLGRTLMFLRTANGGVLVDITGPWE